MKPSPSKHASQVPAPGFIHGLRQLLTRKIWLPKILYEGLPAFYALAGIGAVVSTLFVSSWYWVLPYCWLLGLMCLHAAVAVWRVRRRYRRAHRDEVAKQAHEGSEDAGAAAASQSDSQLRE